jgi:ectoine hydroxylase-related dioxygenase (phytanoyl-CoA dioxygenase family)
VFRKRPIVEGGSAPIFEELLTDRVAAVIDAVLGTSTWDWPATWGEFLMTFPNAPAWTLPQDGWHQDWDFDVECDPVRWVKAFAFMNEVGPGGGGTLVVAGAHGVAGRYGGGRALDHQGRVLKGSSLLYQECGYLRELTSAGDPEERRRSFMDRETEVDGVALQVIELTGKPGDVVLIHPWLVHAVAPNAAAAPRFMRAPVFARRGSFA